MYKCIYIYTHMHVIHSLKPVCWTHACRNHHPRLCDGQNMRPLTEASYILGTAGLACERLGFRVEGPADKSLRPEDLFCESFGGCILDIERENFKLLGLIYYVALSLKVRTFWGPVVEEERDEPARKR